MNAPVAPAHVPPQLVRHFDYLDSPGDADVFDFFGRLHDGPDLFYSTANHGHWVATRYEDMAHILEHTADFSSEAHTVPREGKPFPLPLVEYDGPSHADFRKLLHPFFQPRAVAALQSRAREDTVRLIEGFRARGGCDFTSEFAFRMPIAIMMGLLGLPDADREHLVGLAHGLIRGDSVQRKAVFADIFRYFGEQVIPQRRAQPGDDVFSALVHGKVEGGRSLTDQELLGMGALLIAAGLDTVANVLCFMIRFLAENPGHRRQLVGQPERIDDAVEELLRRFHVTVIARMVTRDLEYKGLVFKARELILLPTPLAGIDPRRFPDPLTVDFARADKRSLVFGRGPHLCIGAFLGRAELRVFLAEWMRRIPDFAVKPGAQLRSRSGRTLSIPELPIVWPPP
ncbi:MAG TPA: cytochrome P450 [Nevskiaceae bacterium]|nr:cytochrome P450 [Nevskiaceae bacterium]